MTDNEIYLLIDYKTTPETTRDDMSLILNTLKPFLSDLSVKFAEEIFSKLYVIMNDHKDNESFLKEAMLNIPELENNYSTNGFLVNFFKFFKPFHDFEQDLINLSNKELSTLIQLKTTFDNNKMKRVKEVKDYLKTIKLKSSEHAKNSVFFKQNPCLYYRIRSDIKLIHDAFLTKIENDIKDNKNEEYLISHCYSNNFHFVKLNDKKEYISICKKYKHSVSKPIDFGHITCAACLNKVISLSLKRL